MTNLKINISVIILLGFSLSGYSQESINSAGGDASSSDGTVNFSIGQDFYYYNNAGNDGSINEGVQQPFDAIDVPSSFNYSPSKISTNYGSATTTGQPSINSGGEPAIFSIVGTTPTGVSINPQTGEIAYTNKLLVGVYNITVAASNSEGSVTSDVELTVKGIAPNGVSFSPASINTAFGTESKSTSPNITDGGLPVTYSISGIVPAGISIDPLTGIVTSSNKTDAGIYTLAIKASNSAGESVTQFVVTVTSDSNIPEGFSPNGDGVNDYFQLVGMHNGPYKLTIFNRWGNIVYEAENYQNTWGGETSKAFSLLESDGKLPDATYYYIIESSSEKAKVGYVYINRSVTR